MSETYTYGMYTCNRCGDNYFVNDGTFRTCSPTLCQTCFAIMAERQNAMLAARSAKGEK